VEPQPHKRAFVRGAEKKQRQVGWHVHIVAKNLIVHQFPSRLNRTCLTNRNTGIIVAAVPVISSEAIQENITDGKDFWAVYSRPEYLTLLSMDIK
jgi:hypothetical protein